jgi:uncharacterized protein YjbI with pentapeptide repeats
VTQILDIYGKVLFEGDDPFAILVEANKANLQEANLQGAYLRGANLQGANLQGTNLQEANLQGADLQGANLRGANLQDTVLDPSNIPNMRGSDLFEERSEGELLGYRTRISTHVGSQEYKGGETYKAPYFSTSDGKCHPGLYVFPTREQTEKWDRKNVGIVQVTFKKEDLHQAGDKWRVRKFTVLKTAQSFTATGIAETYKT